VGAHEQQKKHQESGAEREQLLDLPTPQLAFEFSNDETKVLAAIDEWFEFFDQEFSIDDCGRASCREGDGVLADLGLKLCLTRIAEALNLAGAKNEATKQMASGPELSIYTSECNGPSELIDYWFWAEQRRNHCANVLQFRALHAPVRLNGNVLPSELPLGLIIEGRTIRRKGAQYSYLPPIDWSQSHRKRQVFAQVLRAYPDTAQITDGKSSANSQLKSQMNDDLGKLDLLITPQYWKLEESTR